MAATVEEKSRVESLPILRESLPGSPELVRKVDHFVSEFPWNGPDRYRPKIYRQRREELMANLPSNAPLLVAGGKEFTRNLDVEFPFRQESDFYYLTGFDEPDAAAIIEYSRYTLIVRPRDPEKEQWTGYRAGTEGAKKNYEATHAHPSDELTATIEAVCKEAKKVFFIPAVANTALNEKIQTILKSTGVECVDVSDRVHKLRLVKTPYEIALLKQANIITWKGHVSAMVDGKLTREMMERDPKHARGRNEGEIRASLESAFTRGGAPRVAYPSIVASGANGTILHYVANNAYAQPGDLVLIDAACEYGYQGADVTRTWPVSGRFTPEQRAIYEIVLNVQKTGIEATRSGATIEEIHDHCARLLTASLVELGIMKGNVDKLVEAKTYRQFFPHSIGHFLGMDVHDVCGEKDQGAYKQVKLEPGMVITIEPGIYIKKDDETVDPKWRGIAVRLEDNIVVTEGDPINLSGETPKEVDEVEAIMNG